MKKPQWMAICLALALSGCGGGSKQQVEPLTGTLQAGRPQGIQFQTPSQTGSTDADGRFTYLPGETVTFSVAAVELGSVPGAAEVSLFTLAGLTPPTTERALRRELDRIQRISTPFARAVNMARLLMMLDADGNPDNGLDVRGREGLVTAGSVNLDLRVVDFAARIEQRSPLLTRNIPVWLPVVKLYRDVNVVVRAHGVTRTDVPAGLGLPPRTFYSYYDANGALSEEASDDDGDGALDTFYRRTHDHMYRVLSFDGNDDANQDGVPDDTRRVRYVFDARGNLSEASEAYDIDGDGLGIHSIVQELYFDEAGDLGGRELREDRNGDAVVDARADGAATFDGRHNLLSAVWSYDVDANGVIDSISTNTYVYDAQDHLVTHTYEFDVGADGAVDERIREEFWYTPRGLVERSVYTADYDLADGPEYIDRYALTYDRNGNPATSRVESDYDADGTIDSQVLTTAEFDGDGRLLSEARDLDIDADGTFEERSRSSVTFDAIGNPLQEVHDLDVGMDSSFEYRLVTVHEYGAGGQRLAYGSIYESEPGDPVFIPSTRLTQELFDDGVLTLAQYYFTHSAP